VDVIRFMQYHKIVFFAVPQQWFIYDDETALLNIFVSITEVYRI